MFRTILNLAGKAKERLEVSRKRRRWEKLRQRGMHLGRQVNLPMSTGIDYSHCYLISIGDKCGFGDDCVILAHDAMPNELLDATVIGKVTIHESCHFGSRTVILPGVTVGPRSIVGSNSVVAKDIPPDTVAVGNPAKVICTTEEYLQKHRQAMETAPLFPFKQYADQYLTPERKREMIEKLENTPGYITGGYTALSKDGEGVVRTE